MPGTSLAVDTGQDRRHVLCADAVEVQVHLLPGGQRPRLRAALQGQRDGPGVVRPAARAGGPLSNYLPYDNRGAAVAPKIPDDRRGQVNGLGVISLSVGKEAFSRGLCLVIGPARFPAERAWVLNWFRPRFPDLST